MSYEQLERLLENVETSCRELRLALQGQTNEDKTKHDALAKLLDKLDVSMRAYNCIRANCVSVEHLCNITASQMEIWKNIGPVTIIEIIVALERAKIPHKLRDNASPRIRRRIEHAQKRGEII
jgi:DNA-directed RNA polymerase alpha subunit